MTRSRRGVYAPLPSPRPPTSTGETSSGRPPMPGKNLSTETAAQHPVSVDEGPFYANASVRFLESEKRRLHNRLFARGDIA